MSWLSYGLLCLAALTAVPVLVLFFQVVLASFANTRGHEVSLDGKRLLVLVPAHNESLVIGGTLSAILPQLRPEDRVLVVADNCTDDTASITRELGAEVVERTNLEQRGKGFALDFGVRQVADNPPDVLLIVDADCQVAKGALFQLASASLAEQRPVQGLYLMYSPADSGLKTRLAEFAWRVKNEVRPLGWRRLGLPCQLMGTGMAFPWAMAEHMDLANANIVEDMKLGIDLAVDGTPPVFCPGALVSSEFPSGEKATQSQRTRWEHGHLGMIVQELPRLLGLAIVRLDYRLFGLALDLSVPPLALLVLMLFATIGVTGLGALLVADALVPFYLACVSLALFAGAIMLAWLGWGRQIVSLSELLSVPGYILAKIPLYLGFAVRRQKEWVRTDRD